MIHIVLGMGRGGTSVVSMLLQEMGITMATEQNFGNYEDTEFRKEFTFPEIKQLIDKRSTQFTKWGWKYPPLAQSPILDEVLAYTKAKVIIVIRDPLAVGISAYRRGNHDLKGFTKLTLDLYSKLLHYDALFVSYEKLLTETEETVQEIKDYVEGDGDVRELAKLVKPHPDKYSFGYKEDSIKYTVFPESKLAHKYLDDLTGIEIGASAHNPFGLDTINVDYTDEVTKFKKAEVKMCGEYAKVDVVADALFLPFKNEEFDFVVSSHQIEHCYNIIGTVDSFKRVIKKGGYILLIAPKPEVVPEDEVIPLITFLKRIGSPNNGDGGHCSVCTLDTMKEIFKYLDLDIVEALETDDKVGNGYLILGQKK